MSGQCYGCGAEFGLFKKERGCKNCGFAFCNKCLNEKSIPVPKKNNAKHHVCYKCFKILTGTAPPSTEEPNFDPPEAYLKRIAALKERDSGGQSSHAASQSSGPRPVVPEHLRRLDKADRDIAMRLEKLKAEDKPKEKVSDSDLQQRLAQLKGQQDVPEQKPVYKPPDNRSETQQVDDLIEQLIAEVDIDSLRSDPGQDVEDRPVTLRQGNGAKVVIDRNNLSQYFDKVSMDGNDLNKMDKMGSIGAVGHSQATRNIQMDNTENSDRDPEQIDMKEMQKLMLQASREAEFESQRAMKGLQQDAELMDRLRELQKVEKISNDGDAVDSDADNTVQCENAAVSDDEDDDVGAKKIIERYADEVRIDAAAGVPSDKPTQQSSSSGRKKKKHADSASTTAVELKPSNLKPPKTEEPVDSDYDDADELPYCCMCTEDATVRCRDCDMDLYCQKCFRYNYVFLCVFAQS
uniref:FYVE-type domain-containing protein n=1 Tax=Arion vulgaris TaxID=1028688 RepID=A0A0B7A532_9EUPU